MAYFPTEKAWRVYCDEQMVNKLKALAEQPKPDADKAKKAE